MLLNRLRRCIQSTSKYFADQRTPFLYHTKSVSHQPFSSNFIATIMTRQQQQQQQQPQQPAVPPPPVSEVFIADPEGLEKKKQAIKEGGHSQLQVISDFDMTLTKFMVNGKRGLSSHGIVEHSRLLSEEYHNTVKELFEKYYPLEVSTEIDYKQKYKYMEEWWDLAHQALIKARINKKMIPKMVEGGNVDFRTGVRELFNTLATHDVPLLVFSAGLGDILEQVLVHRVGPLTPNMHVVSNYMTYDDEGYCVGFKTRNIHVFNKNETSLHGTKFADDVKSRHNVILLGDGEGDVHMADGVQVSNIIKIGFLNDRVSERLDAYMQTFDIVVTHDGDMKVVNDLLAEIASARGFDEH
eukprot:Colp12_sorted_trinity150504_noHs@3692